MVAGLAKFTERNSDMLALYMLSMIGILYRECDRYLLWRAMNQIIQVTAPKCCGPPGVLKRDWTEQEVVQNTLLFTQTNAIWKDF